MNNRAGQRYGTKTPAVCAFCLKNFTHTEGWRPRTFCTRACYWQSTIGKKIPEAQIEKMRASNTGKIRTEEMKQKYSLARVDYFDKEGRRARFKRPQHAGGMAVKFSRNVLRHDGYTCQMCNIRGGKLHADHVIPFIELVNDMNIKTLEEAMKNEILWDTTNGRTLCASCHRKTNTYGRRYSQAFVAT